VARILYCHPVKTHYLFHIYTDLDFWDARRRLKGLALVKRNFGHDPSGDEFPTQVVGSDLSLKQKQEIERRLKKAIISPPRHVVVSAMLTHGFFEFDPAKYYPARWGRSKMIRFTYYRLPLEQTALNSPYKRVQLTWSGDSIRVEQVPRKEKYDPVIKSRKEAIRRLMVPSAF
jgi:hypothetical protein